MVHHSFDRIGQTSFSGLHLAPINGCTLPQVTKEIVTESFSKTETASVPDAVSPIKF